MMLTRIVLLLAMSAPCVAAVPQLAAGPVLNSAVLVADDTTLYTVTLTVSDGDGYNDIRQGRVLFNYTEAGGTTSKGRGYLAWGVSDAVIMTWGGNWELGDAEGGGRWGYSRDDWGGTTYVTPAACATSVAGKASGGSGSRTIGFSFRVKPAWAWSPLVNDADVFFGDGSYISGWRDAGDSFDVVGAACTTYVATPQAPVVSVVNGGAVDVSIHPADSGTDLFAIRVSPSLGGRMWLQQDGSAGLSPAWLSKSAWGTRRVSGLMWTNTYAFDARATRNLSGYCPSGFGPPATVVLPAELPRLDYRSGTPFDVWVRGQCPYRMITTAGYPQLWSITQGSLARGLAGGLDADTYDWRDITSGSNWGQGGGAYTTLQFLQHARDYLAAPMLTANVFGGGYKDEANQGVFVCQTADPEGLAADWVRYTNIILQTYRQGQEGAMSSEDRRVYDAIANWGGKPKLLAPAEPAVPPVRHWEIGNEPEVPGIHPMLNNHYLGPTDYRDRYKSIARAMRAVDATLEFGPCLTNPSDPNAQWLPTLAADPEVPIQFISYHPYYSGIKYAWGSPEAITDGLRAMKDTLNGVSRSIRSIMSKQGRGEVGLIASEWNPVNWDGTGQMQASMANALGVAETVFTFAEDGVQGGTFWEQPQSKLGPRNMFEALRDYMGDTLIANVESLGLAHAALNWRIYVTRHSGDDRRLAIWGLNFEDAQSVSIDLTIPYCRIDSARVRRYGNPAGDSSLMMSSGMSWTEQPAAGLNAGRFTFTMQDAEATILLLDITPLARVDFDLDGDVDQADFGRFQTCLTGSTIPVTDPACRDALLDADQDVDQQDLWRFTACFTGPGLAADYRCTD